MSDSFAVPSSPIAVVGLGAIMPDALDADARAYYLREAAKLDITVDEIIQRRAY